MKVAVAIWHERISPVFDVARRLLVLDVADGREIEREEQVIEETQPALRVKRLCGLGISVLICGAISRPLEEMLVSSGVRVIPQTCGPAEDVLNAFIAGRLTEEVFLLPGCCGRRRRLRGRHASGGRRRTGSQRGAT